MSTAFFLPKMPEVPDIITPMVEAALEKQYESLEAQARAYLRAGFEVDELTWRGQTAPSRS
jgi:hypothetical protein